MCCSRTKQKICEEFCNIDIYISSEEGETILNVKNAKRSQLPSLKYKNICIHKTVKQKAEIPIKYLVKTDFRCKS